MKRIVIALTLAINFFYASIVFAQNTCTVSGEGVYSGDSNIYIFMLNSTTFPKFVSRQIELPPSEFGQIIKANASGKAPFMFKNIPKGEYLIIAFADENNNAQLDRDTYGMPIEPVCTYRVTRGMWNWNDQKFEVNKDVTGLLLKFRD